MKLNDLSIGTQLRAGLGAILMLIGLLGATAWYQTDLMWQETKGLYDHPFQVRMAIGEIKADVLAMRMGMKDLVHAKNNEDLDRIVQSVDLHEAGVMNRFPVVLDRYLGPKNEVTEAQNAFVQWKSIRNETIRLIRTGDIAAARKRTENTGIGADHYEKIMQNIGRIESFAQTRGERFYQKAAERKNQLNLHLYFILAGILALSFGIVVLLLKTIRSPLVELTAAAEKYRLGDLNARSAFASANEVGTLSASFNHLADTVQAELKINESSAQISDVLLWEETLHDFCRELLKALLTHTGSQMGAVYLLNEEKTEFMHCESIGLNAGSRMSFSASDHEGEFGAVLAAKTVQHITVIPEDTHFIFSTVSGDFRPREILTVPVLDGDTVIGVISLATIRDYSAIHLKIIDDTLRVITARMISVLALRQIKDFSKKLEIQNTELNEQKRELAMQADELSEQNIELEIQKKQLDEASRLKSSFLSNMSHELRTPLNSVIALSSVLNKRLKDAIPVEEYSYLDVIERNGKQLLMLINDILDLSRIESGREELSLSSFSMRDLVGDITEMLMPQAEEKGIVITNTISPDLPCIISDPAKCRHILQNIIGNAVKFTDTGSVAISASVTDNLLEISVADTGIGIPADRIPFIFDEFRQADESMSRKYGGTGLGLAIAKKYAAFLRGYLAVSSEPGRGSVFTVRLPLTIDGAARLSRESAIPESKTCTAHRSDPMVSGKTILLVEDSEPAVIQVKDILLEQGYRVLVARSGREALEQIAETVPDGMILDLMMPEMDGFAVLKAIRAEEKSSHLPVLILTAKQITPEDLSFLKVNHVYQLVRKGAVGKAELLNAVARMVSATPDPAPKRPKKPGTRKPVVLVIEDNADNMLTVKALLADHCTVLEASTGESGVAQARTYEPDLILMDISLPGLNGYEAFDAIRHDPNLAHIPIVALTANVMRGNREDILKYGFDGFIPKPIDELLFWQIVRERLDSHGE